MSSQQVQEPEATIRKDRLKAFVDALAPCGEVVVQITHDGWRTQAVDPANVMQVEAALYAPAFDSHSATGDMAFAFDMPTFREYLDRLEDDHATVHLTFDTDRSWFTARYGAFEWEAAWIDPDSVRSGADVSVDLPAKFTVEDYDLRAAIEWADWVANPKDNDYPVFSYSPDGGFSVRTEANVNHGEYTLSPAELPEISEEPDEPVETVYPTSYLTDIAEAIIDVPCRVELGQEYPLIVSQAIADGEGEVAYYVAPRVYSE